MSNVITKEQLDSVTYESVLQLREIRVLRAEITEPLTLRQFEPLMFTTHLEFAFGVLKVSKSKVLQAKAHRMIQLWNLIKYGEETKAVSRE